MRITGKMVLIDRIIPIIIRINKIYCCSVIRRVIQIKSLNSISSSSFTQPKLRGKIICHHHAITGIGCNRNTVTVRCMNSVFRCNNLIGMGIYVNELSRQRLVRIHIYAINQGSCIGRRVRIPHQLRRGIIAGLAPLFHFE